MEDLIKNVVSNSKILSSWSSFISNLNTESIKYQVAKSAKDNLNKQVAFEDNKNFYLLPTDINLQKPFVAKSITQRVDSNGNKFGKTNVKLMPICDKFLEEIEAKHTLLGVIGLILLIATIGLFLTFTLYFTIMAFLFFCFCLFLFASGSGNNNANGGAETFGKALIAGMGIAALGSSI